ncbi:MAG: hypothetical protein D0433_13795 [Candidatus Thermochlorobacter aerophilum]|uniref:S-layer family protein n=1 Tax=Candidatus Thermochlorobacter aerophilus TaxID=1868324 RepID=A0A395LW08_9BACT|nr:MAG: hypothetical protein D0433_13795 [Candidatus Thermochlorobacter aerophilum]
MTNDGTISFRIPDGAFFDIVNINLSGNLEGAGTSTFNNITFNGTSNQTISIGGTIYNIQAVTYNNTGTAPNNQITNQSTTFTTAINPGTSTFTRGNYRHDNTGIYNVSTGTVAFGGADMTVTVLQGTMNFATGNNVLDQLNLNGGDLIVDGPNAVVNVGGNETTDRQKLLTNGTTADITVQNGGTLNVGNGTYGDIRFDGNAGTMWVTGTSITGKSSEVNCGRIVTGNNAGNGGTLTISDGAIMRVRYNATTAGPAVLFRGTSTIRVESGAQFLIGNPTNSTGNLEADENNSFVRNMTVDNATVRVYGRWLVSAGVNNTNTRFDIDNGSQFIVSENVINVGAAQTCNLGRATINVNSGSTVRLFQNAQSANNVNVCVIGAGGQFEH